MGRRMSLLIAAIVSSLMLVSVSPSTAAVASSPFTVKNLPNEITVTLGSTRAFSSGTVESSRTITNVIVRVDGNKAIHTYYPPDTTKFDLTKMVVDARITTQLPTTGKYTLVVTAVTQGSSTETEIGRIPLVVTGATSRQGVEFLLHEEGWSPILYDNDGAKVRNCTIGYGHLIHPGKCVGPRNSGESPFYDTKGNKIRLEPKYAYALFTYPFIVKAEKYFNDHFVIKYGTQLRQNQFDALVSFYYNYPDLGTNLKSALRAGNHTEVAKQFVSGWEKSEVKGRREREQRLYQSGSYEPLNSFIPLPW